MKLFYILLGFLCIGLGGVGVITPGLPTTPFLLLAFYCFSKSSDRLKNWFMATALYDKYLKNYDQKRAMTMKQKVSILGFSAPFCIFAFWVMPSIWGRIALVIVVIIQYYYFFFKIKTIESE